MSAVLTPSAVDLTRPQAAAAALRTFFRIAERWKLTPSQQLVLLGVARSTLYEWKAGRVRRPLDPVTLERLSYIFGVYAALQTLFPRPERADEWLRKPNEAPFLGGKSALERMLAGNVGDLYAMRQYLDAQCAGAA